MSGSIILEGWHLLGIAIILCALIALLGLRLRLRRREIAALAGQLANAEREIADQRRQIETMRQLQFIDAVTGIPNAAKWEADVERLGREVFERPVQAAIIDFVGVGRLNDEHGHQKVDEILRYLATNLDEQMRKGEGLYRRPIEEPVDADRLYRKYQGGDEFYVLIRGTESDMLGLLVRLHRLTKGEISAQIDKHIASLAEPLRFYGSVCQLQPGETVTRLIGRLVEGLRVARAGRESTRLHWQSGQQSFDLPEDSRERSLYEAAEAEFTATAR